MRPRGSHPTVSTSVRAIKLTPFVTFGGMEKKYTTIYARIFIKNLYYFSRLICFGLNHFCFDEIASDYLPYCRCLNVFVLCDWAFPTFVVVEDHPIGYSDRNVLKIARIITSGPYICCPYWHCKKGGSTNAKKFQEPLYGCWNGNPKIFLIWKLMLKESSWF